MNIPLSDAFQRFLALTHPLEEDIQRIGQSISVLDGANQDSMKRAYVRAVLARIEASVFALKQLAIERDTAGSLTLGERQLLAETTYFLGRKGEVKERPSFSSLRENIRFTFRVLSKVLRLDYEFVSGAGWDAMKEAVDVRNRITHPKVPGELSITKEEIEKVKSAMHWFDCQWSEIGRLHKEKAFKLAREEGATEEEIAALEAQSKIMLKQTHQALKDKK